MHVSLRAFDVVVQVVAEVLDMADGRVRDDRIGKVTREQDEGYVAHIIRLSKVGKMTKFKGRIPGGV